MSTTITTYNDIFMRPNLTDPVGQIPSAPPVTDCPDIICAGQTPIANFQTVLASTASWNQSYPANLSQGLPNYIYVRGMNNYSGAQTGQVYLYYMPNSIINWPNQWVSNQIPTTRDKSDPDYWYANLTAAASGDVVVGDAPFLWVPGPVPSGSDHYCLIAQVVTSEHPNPIPGATSVTYEDMGTLVANNPAFGWRNTVLLNANAPNQTFNTTLTIPESVGTTQTVNLYVACSGIPAGYSVGFTCSATDANGNPITLPETTVTAPNQTIGVTAPLAPGFEAVVTLEIWGNAQMSSGSGFSLEAAYNPSTTLEEGHPLYNEAFIARLTGADTLGITPTTPVYLGSMQYLTP
jgi:hypothetical protein